MADSGSTSEEHTLYHVITVTLLEDLVQLDLSFHSSILPSIHLLLIHSCIIQLHSHCLLKFYYILDIRFNVKEYKEE